jgi:hypothetical protein
VAFCGYLLLGGRHLFFRPAPDLIAPGADASTVADADTDSGPFTRAQRLTLGVIATLILAVVFFQLNVGMVALTGAVLLTFARAVERPRPSSRCRGKPS